MNKRVHNGSLAEATFIKKALELGYKVNIPFSHDVPYDMILDYNGHLIKAQVKKAYNAVERKKKVINCELRRVGNTGVKTFYKDGDFDYLAAVHCETEKIWYIPLSHIKNNKSGIRISSKKWDKYII